MPGFRGFDQAILKLVDRRGGGTGWTGRTLMVIRGVGSLRPCAEPDMYEERGYRTSRAMKLADARTGRDGRA